MTTPPPYTGPQSGGWPVASDRPARRSVRVWDVVVSIVLLVLLAGLAALMSFFGFFLAMASDPCGALDCNTDLIAVGMITAVVLPWVLLVIAVVVAIVLLVKRRIAFWVPLVASPLVIGSWFVGAVIASMGVPGTSF